MSTLEILSESENKLLSRKELQCKFVGGNGLITRQAAIEAIAARLSVDKSRVRVISLRGKFGIRDVHASAFVYNDTSAMKEQLPNYISIRDLPKEERKKAREDIKKKKAESKSSSQHASAPGQKK